jgi:hypothetical protein
MNDHIEQLLGRLETGSASEADLKEIERLLESGELEIDDIDSFALLQNQIMRMDSPLPSAALNQRFYQMLSSEKRRSKRFLWKDFFSWPAVAPRLATACLMLIAGFAAGYFLRPSATTPNDGQIAVLSQQLTGLQEMMMLSLLEKGSATERLKAVNLTQEMSAASRKVTTALIATLNEDENVNVRLAALDALKPYARDPYVREALIRSISKQESPLLQVSLAELMAALQEKSAVKEFEKIVESENMPAEVRKKIRESIETII